MKNQNRRTSSHYLKGIIILLLFLAILPSYPAAQTFDLTPVSYFPVQKMYSDIAVSSKGYIYLLSAELSLVDQYSVSGKISASYGKSGSGKQELKTPSSIWAQNDLNIYISDYENDRIVMLTSELGFISSIEGQSYELNHLFFRKPLFAAVLYNSDLLILDGEEKSFLRYNKNRSTSERFGGIESGNYRLLEPTKVSYGNNQIAVYDQADSTFKIYSDLGNPLNVVRHKNSPCRNWNQSWVTIINNCLTELSDGKSQLIDFNPYIDEPIINFEILANRFYILTATKVVILNASKL